MRGNKIPQKRMHSFVQSVVAAKLLARLGYSTLANVPASLPEPIRSDFRTKLQAHLEEVDQNGLPWRELENGSWVADPVIADDPDGLANDIAFLMFFAPEDAREHGLRQQLPLEQCLVMQFAHLDAFLQDLFKAACEKDHRILRSNKQLSFDDVVQSGNWENVIAVLIEKLLFELGCTDLEGKIKLIEKTLHLELQIPQDLLENLKLAEQARHAFVHTGGFVTPTIVARVKTDEYEPGNRLSISPDYCDQVSEGIVAFGRSAYQAIAAKFWPEMESRILE